MKPFEPVVVAIVFNAPIVALPNDAVFARASVEDEKLENSDVVVAFDAVISANAFTPMNVLSVYVFGIDVDATTK